MHVKQMLAAEHVLHEFTHGMHWASEEYKVGGHWDSHMLPFKLYPEMHVLQEVADELRHCSHGYVHFWQ